MITQVADHAVRQVDRVPGLKSELGCSWWNLACQGGHELADSGMSAITRSIASGANLLLGEIVKVVDESTTVPLDDPTYRHVYAGFLGLAAPLIGVVLLAAIVMASLRRDPATLGRGVVGIAVASIGGALYIVFAQLLVAIDDWLAHGIVRVTGYNLTDALNELAEGFGRVAGDQGTFSANMLILLLMLVMLVAGMILWFVLVLRKIAILVVVAFAPLLIAGYLWAPTRAWVRQATQVLVALVFTKSAIFALFGIGLALLSRGTGQSLSDFVGTAVLMCGACFAPMVMLRLVHFAADTQLAGDMMGTLRAGAHPVTSRIPTPWGGTQGRKDFARSQAESATPESDAPRAAGRIDTGTAAAQGAADGAAGATGAGGVLLAAQAADRTRRRAQGAATDTGQELRGTPQPHTPDPGERNLPGPSLPSTPPADPEEEP